MTDSKSVKFRASSVGQLMVGGNAITEKQLARLAELEARRLDAKAKPLTATMQSELDDLIAKRDGDFKFGATAINYIRDCWLRNVYQYEEPIVTNEMLKGIMCESEAIGVLTRRFPGEFRVKNEDSWEDDHFTGTPDVVLDDYIEDIKCSWTLRTFVETRKPDPIYYAQGQVYMALTGRKAFRLAHVLVDTPREIVEEEIKRFYFRFNCDEENHHYKTAAEKIERMHSPSSLIPEHHRIKVFEFERNDQFIETLRSRVEIARRLYASMTLGDEDE